MRISVMLRIETNKPKLMLFFSFLPDFPVLFVVILPD